LLLHSIRIQLRLQQGRVLRLRAETACVSFAAAKLAQASNYA
jgi:hypothetical protein